MMRIAAVAMLLCLLREACVDITAAETSLLCQIEGGQHAGIDDLVAHAKAMCAL